MKIWVDADACPNVVKKIIYKSANKRKIIATFVSNQGLNLPISSFIKRLEVPFGFDVADNKIIEIMQAGDLVITADIPLASFVIEKEGIALNPRGELYTTSNIKQRLSMRDFFEGLRSSGVNTGGPKPMSKSELQKFANYLDQILQAKK